MSSSRHQRELRLPPQAAGRRLDQALADALPEYSRSRLKRWIDEGQLRVDGRVPRPRHIVAGGERIDLDAPDDDAGAPLAQEIALIATRTLKSSSWTSRGPRRSPRRRQSDQTLQNAARARPRLAKLPRAGIVHRLGQAPPGSSSSRAASPPGSSWPMSSPRAKSIVNTRQSASA
jgi:23S rRNA pseudouridine1911/1915/1917 synthase